MRIDTFFRRRSFSRSSASSRASISDHEDDDAITPIETEERAKSYTQEKPQQQHIEMRSQQTASKPADLDNAVLWHRMLNLQRRYHCYKSARMTAALEDEYLEAVVPPRACLDLLNDSMATGYLCEEARAEVAALLVFVPERSRSRGGSYGDIKATNTTTN